jgi:hypothetical protein
MQQTRYKMSLILKELLMILLRSTKESSLRMISPPGMPKIWGQLIPDMIPHFNSVELDLTISNLLLLNSLLLIQRSIRGNCGLYRLAKVNLGLWQLWLWLSYCSWMPLKSISFMAIDISWEETRKILPSIGAVKTSKIRLNTIAHWIRLTAKKVSWS